MAFSFEGRLGQQLLPDLLRDIAFKQLDGALRLSLDKTSKTLAFESGEPINAFSSIPSEQIDTVLIRDGRTTEGLVSTAKRGQSDPALLAVALVEKGIVSADVMKKAASELAARIALSMFEWTDAEYHFEETKQLCPRVLQTSTAELVIEGTRQAASHLRFIDLVAPSDLWVMRRQTVGDHLAAAANLNSTEGYIFSMTNSPIRLTEIATLSGLPDEQIRRAVCVLLALGDPLKRRDYDRPPAAAGRTIRGINGGGAAGGNNGRSGQPAVRPAPERPVAIPVTSPPPALPKPPIAESIIERGQASDSPRNGPNGLKLPPRKPIPMPELKMPVAPSNDSSRGIERGRRDGSRPLPTAPRPAVPQTRPPAVLSPEEAARLQTPANKDEQALRFYRQGRMRFERRELEAAAHFFREAVRLDPTQSHYHFYLAMVLSIQARARHEHLHHEGCHVTCHLGGALVSNPKVRYEAEQHFLRASQIDPSNAQIALKLGQLYKEVGLLKKAELYLRQALLLDSRNETARHELDTLHECREEGDDADDKLEIEVR